MATLSGNKIKNTYQSLVKFSDNGNITTSAKQLTDGFGNNSPMFVSTTQVGIGVTPESGLNLHVFGDAKIGSNLTVIGNLVVEGSTTTVGTDTLTVKDPLIVLANNNTSTDAVDIGFYGKYHPSDTTLYSGLFREALTGKYRLFKSLEVEPTTTVNTSGTGYAVATLIANLEGNVTGNLTGNVTGNLTGNVTATSVLANGVTATTQSDGDNSTKVATTAYVDTAITGHDTLAEILSGGNTTGGTDIAVSAGDDITFTDTSKSIYGTDGELEIHHNGSNSYITEDGTGALYLQGTYMYLTKSDGSQNYIELDLDGATDSRVKLNYGGATKLQTTNTGLTVTGIISGLTDPSAAQDAATKAYVDSAVEGQDTLAEILAIGNTSGGTSMIISNGDDLTVNTSTLKVDSTNSQVGINNASPSGFTTDSNDLIIGDGTGNRGMTIYSSSLAYGHLFFNDAETGGSLNGGFISYGHNGDFFEIGVAGNGLGAGSLSISETSVYTKENFVVDASSTNVYNTLTVDASAAKLGIRNNAPTYPLDVNGEARFGAAYVTSDLTVGTDTLFVDASEDSVGIGLTNPSDYVYDALVINVPDESGISLVSGVDDIAHISFVNGTAIGNRNGYISYNHDTDTLIAFAQSKVAIDIVEATVAYFTDTACHIDKNTTIAGTVTTDKVFIAKGQNVSSIANSIIVSQESANLSQIRCYGSDVEHTGNLEFILDDGGNGGSNITPLTLNSDGSSTFTGVITVKNHATTSSVATQFINGKRTSGTAAFGELIFSNNNDSVATIAGFRDGADDKGSLLFQTQDGSNGFGTRLTIDSSGKATFADDVTIGGTEYINNIQARTSAGLKVGNDDFSGFIFISNEDSRVGIGTESPDYTLHLLKSSGDTEMYINGQNGQSSLRMGLDARNWQIKTAAAPYLWSLNYVGTDFQTPNIITATVGGNVGIGTDTPDITGFGWNALTVMGGTTAGSAGVLELATPSTDANNQNLGIIAFMGGTSRNAQIASNRDAATNDGRLSFWTSPGAGGIEERMRIDSSGNVGIGITPNASFSGVEVLQLGKGMTLMGNSNDDRAAMMANLYLDSGTAFRYVMDGLAGKVAIEDGNITFGTAPSGTVGAVATVTERLRIDSSGDVSVYGTDNRPLAITSFDTVSAGAGWDLDATSSNGVITMSTGATERMRINSSGYIYVNTGGVEPSASQVGVRITGTQGQSFWNSANSGTAGYNHFNFYNGNGAVGSIVTSGSATAYNTSSDYRLKENVVEMTGALDRVSQLKPSRFNFIADADKTVDGFLAHEVQEIVPEAITGEKDGMQDEEYEVSPAVYEDVIHPAEEAVYETIEHPAVEEELDDEGNVVVEAVEAYTEEVIVTEAKEEWTEKVLVTEKVIGTREVPDYQGIDQSKLVPLLVGAIQELKAEVESLKLQINN